MLKVEISIMDNRERLRLVLKQRDGLRLAVVQDCEVFLLQVRHQPSLVVGDRHRHDAGAALEVACCPEDRYSGEYERGE